MHPYSPEVMALSCLRADAERVAETCVGSFWDIAPELAQPENADVLAALQEPKFVLKLPLLFQQQDLDNKIKGPVLHFEGGQPTLAVNMNGMSACSPRGQHTLDKLCSLFEVSWTRSWMVPGQMALILNRSAVHTRTSAFTVKADGTDRWLLRTFVHPSPPLRIIPKDRQDLNSMKAAIEQLSRNPAIDSEEILSDAETVGSMFS